MQSSSEKWKRKARYINSEFDRSHAQQNYNKWMYWSTMAHKHNTQKTPPSLEAVIN